jgi:hypothetical protein
MQGLLSVLPEDPQNIYWDDVYSKRNYKRDEGNNDFSTFGTIMKYPALKSAFWITLFSAAALHFLQQQAQAKNSAHRKEGRKYQHCIHRSHCRALFE